MTASSLNECRVHLPLFAVFLFAPALAAGYDVDSDGHADEQDNCISVANADQRDSNGDGFGNLCDADLDDDGITGFGDLLIMRQQFLSAAPHSDPVGEHADLNGDGFVAFGDLALLKSLFLRPPGPAGSQLAVNGDSAARFLTQATFGPTAAEINSLVAQGSLENWIDAQQAQPPTNQLNATLAYVIAMCEDPGEDKEFYTLPRQFAWWDTVLNGNDQLRQRVAFALSQILVVSEVGALEEAQLGLASYYDVLSSHAFGNYRDLLQAVTLHPAMGAYLSMLRNERAQPEFNIRPDENYARELMQLFTLGPHLLKADGSLILDASGEPTPAYTQADVESFAAVFTGWNFSNIGWYEYVGFGNYTQPMVAFEEFHDSNAKTLLGGVTLPAERTALQDIEDGLDNIFAQQNLGPFVSRLLIQRLVTSNPTPRYIERVAARFNDNGAGVRGDLGAVVRAILLDPEARLGNVISPLKFGKLREPLLRISQIRRAFDAQPVAHTGTYWEGVDCGQGVYHTWDQPFGQLRLTVGQDILSSPSVFNFYRSDYSPPTVLRPNGLVGPEFQISNANTLVATANLINFEIQNAGDFGDWTAIDASDEIALAANPDALLDHLDRLLMSGQMSATLRQIIHTHLTTADYSFAADVQAVQARDAISLIVTSPEYLIQK